MAKNGTGKKKEQRATRFIFVKTSNMEKELLYKSFDARIEEKAEAENGALSIKFYALAFNNVDSWGDIIAPGACDAFLKSDDAARLKLCYQHNLQEVIGVIKSANVDDYGLLCEAEILPTTTGRDVMVLMKAGAIAEFSIGYYPDEYHFEKREGFRDDIRVLDAITIIEASPVTRAANPKAILVDAKSETSQQALKAMSDQQLSDLGEAVQEERARRFFAYM